MTERKIVYAADLALRMGVKLHTAKKDYPSANENCPCDQPIKKDTRYATYGNPAQGWQNGWRMHYCCFALPECEHWKNPIVERSHTNPRDKP